MAQRYEYYFRVVKTMFLLYGQKSEQANREHRINRKMGKLKRQYPLVYDLRIYLICTQLGPKGHLIKMGTFLQKIYAIYIYIYTVV